MSCSESMKAFGRRLRRFLRSDEAYKILDADVGGTWTAGGCWLLAEALGPVLDAPIVAVWSFLGDDVIQQHAVLQVGPDCYLDADGVQTKRVLLRKMAREENLDRPHLAAFDPRAAHEGGIQCPAVSVRRLRAALRSVLL